MMVNKTKIPNDWKWVNLKEICTIHQGYGFPKDLQGIKNGEYPFYKVGDISKNVKAGYRYLEVCDNFIDENVLIKLKAKPYPINTIVFAKIGEGLKLNRRAILRRLGIVDNNAVGLKAIEKFCHDLYLFHFFTTVKLEDYSRATTVPSVRKSDIEEIPFPLPPITTQQAIVSKIEELFSELDKGIENLRTAQLQLKTYRQAVLKWAFEGRLTNENVKDGELPKRWKMVKTIDVIEIINNGYTPTSQYLSQGSGEIPFIKVYNLNFDGSLNFSKNPTFIPTANHKKDLKRSICLPGDVLINIVGPPLGKVSVVTNQYPEWNINQAIVMFRPNEKVLSKYISYFMQNSATINWLENTSKATAGQWNVKVSTCREIPFPFCSIEEQNRIVFEIESRISVSDKMEESITQSLQKAEGLRQSILKKAFGGALV